MKLKKILPLLALGTLVFQACDDTKMNWYNPHEGNGVTSSEMPLQLAEKISRYDAIKSYIPRPDFVIGLGMGMESYMGSENYQAIVNANFNSVTLGNAMKQSSIMNGKGENNYSNVDAFLEVLPQDIDLYGHNLIWHTQQRANYLNGLIAPDIIVDPDTNDPMDNIFQNSDFEDGTKAPWGSWGNSSSSGVSAKGEGYESDYAMVLNNPTDASNHSAQAGYDLSTPLENGEVYMLRFMAKADVAGSLAAATQRVPGYDNQQYSPTFAVGTSWVPCEWEFTAKYDEVNRILINFGAIAGTYYIDDVKFGKKKLNLDPDAGRINLLANGDFAENIDGWAKWNGPDGCNTFNATEGNLNPGCLQVVNPEDNDGGQWKVQIHSNFIQSIPKETVFYISYYVKTIEGIGSIRVSTTGKDHYQGDQSANPAWTRVEWTVTAGGDVEGMNFDLGLKAGTYLIDDIVVSTDPFNATDTRSAVSRSAVTRGVTIVEKTDEEKEAIISAAMEKWIKEMVGHFKGRVKSWDVLNEPIHDGGKLRGVEIMPDEIGNDEFYYGFYMGKTYGAKAFMWAREADPTALLFINDYNLEYNLNKCDRLIEYAQYIDQNGGQVDGIGTQMHIAIDSNKDNIVEMFKKLAATGKLVRITELDIKVNTSSPTADNLAAQADMYQFVIDKYKEIIPESQQAGITIWTLSDHPDEHVYWIPNDAPNLFDANYARKHAYKGVCDGLAGRDVSVDFPGDLQK